MRLLPKRLGWLYSDHLVSQSRIDDENIQLPATTCNRNSVPKPRTTPSLYRSGPPLELPVGKEEDEDQGPKNDEGYTF